MKKILLIFIVLILNQLCYGRSGNSKAQDIYAMWRFNEGTGTEIKECIGNGDYGTLEGVIAWVDGKFDKGVYLVDGLEETHVDCGMTNELGLSSGTISIWAKPADTYDSGGYFLWGTETSGKYFVAYKYTDNNFYCGWNQGAEQRAVLAMTADLWDKDKWSMWTVTWGLGGCAKLYKNDKLVATAAAVTTDTTAINQEFRIGHSGGNPSDHSFKGVLDECIIYTRILTEGEIADNYNTTKGKYIR